MCCTCTCLDMSSCVYYTLLLGLQSQSSEVSYGLTPYATRRARHRNTLSLASLRRAAMLRYRRLRWAPLCHGPFVHALHIAGESKAHAQHVGVPSATKSSHGGRFLKAVMWKLSERVKATNGKPCLEAGRNRRLPFKWTTIPSLMVSPCALFTVCA